VVNTYIPSRVHLACHEDWLGSTKAPALRTIAMMVVYRLEINMRITLLIAMVMARNFSSGIDGSRISLSKSGERSTSIGVDGISGYRLE
jgi:hypothetical protein